MGKSLREKRILRFSLKETNFTENSKPLRIVQVSSKQLNSSGETISAVRTKLGLGQLLNQRTRRQDQNKTKQTETTCWVSGARLVSKVLTLQAQGCEFDTQTRKHSGTALHFSVGEEKWLPRIFWLPSLSSELQASERPAPKRQGGQCPKNYTHV